MTSTKRLKKYARVHGQRLKPFARAVVQTDRDVGADLKIAATEWLKRKRGR